MSHAATKHSGDGDHLKEHAAAVKDAVAELAVETGHFARHRVGDARDTASAMIDKVKSNAEGYNETLIDFIRENPYKSLAVVAGLGFAAGFILRRR
jgi:ElaB/YqjD/DUF883 family membrane-anchored ribosome-binding protein